MENEKKKPGIGRILLIAFVILLILATIAVVIMFMRLTKEFDSEEKEANDKMNSFVGTEVSDFTVQLTDGSEISFLGLLEDYDAVLVNVFATWCGPCIKEFPEIEKFYQQYGDKVAVIAVDPDAEDELPAIRELQDSSNVTFLMGKVDAKAADILNVAAFPTTYVIDRGGKVGFCQMGTFNDHKAIEKVCTAFIGDTYQEKQVALYTFTVSTKYGSPIANAQIHLHSASVDETLTTDSEGLAYYFTENPEELEVSIVSLPGSYTADKGVLATTHGKLSDWTILYVN